MSPAMAAYVMHVKNLEVPLWLKVGKVFFLVQTNSRAAKYCTVYGHFLVLWVKAHFWNANIIHVRLDEILNEGVVSLNLSCRMRNAGSAGCHSSIGRPVGIQFSSLQSPKPKRHIFWSRFHSSPSWDCTNVSSQLHQQWISNNVVESSINGKFCTECQLWKFLESLISKTRKCQAKVIIFLNRVYHCSRSFLNDTVL